MIPHVAIDNKSTVLTTAQLMPIVAALQTQVDRDFAPVWGISCRLVVETPSPGDWQLVILDDTDQAGVLGYHDLTSQGLPLGKVFAKSDQQYGLKTSVTMSHELLEMLADPWIDLTVFAQSSDTAGMLYAVEVCDAVEDDSLGYDIEGVTVSNFVTPAWFQRGSAGPWDFGNKLKAPLQLASGGYIGVFDVTAGDGWRQVTARSSVSTARIAASIAKGAHARLARRGVPAEMRRLSQECP